MPYPHLGLEESAPGEAEYREVSSGNHRADQETRPPLPAGLQRPEWNRKYSFRPFSKSLTNKTEAHGSFY